MPIELKAEPAQNAGAQKVAENLKGVKKVFAVHSGKGGVGKTTFAVNLAAALARKGFKVGLVDADVDCPSVHSFLGLKGRVLANDVGRIMPKEAFGIKVLSAGSMVSDSDEAKVMRGPVMFTLIFEMLSKAEWGELDYLVIDLPPGTGDNPLTVMQIAPLNGMIIVTQPMEIALTDARKSANMAKKLGVKVLGIVENMSGEIFGEGGGEKTAEKLEVKFLGSIPLKKNVRELSDKGVPAVLEDNELLETFNGIIAEAG